MPFGVKKKIHTQKHYTSDAGTKLNGIFDAVPAITKVIIKYILIILELLFIAVLEERWSTVR